MALSFIEMDKNRNQIAFDKNRSTFFTASHLQGSFIRSKASQHRGNSSRHPPPSIPAADSSNRLLSLKYRWQELSLCPSITWRHCPHNSPEFTISTVAEAAATERTTRVSMHVLNDVAISP